MSNLPKGWFEESMRRIDEERKSWPAWMEAGVREASDRARDRLQKYGIRPNEDDRRKAD